MKYGIYYDMGRDEFFQIPLNDDLAEKIMRRPVWDRKIIETHDAPVEGIAIRSHVLGNLPSTEQK